MSNAIYSAILDSAAGAARAKDAILHAMRVNDSAALCEAARLVDEQGEKRGKEWKNARLSVLRVQLGRVCKELELPKMTVKKVEGNYVLTVAAEKAEKEYDVVAELQKVLDNALEADQRATLLKALRAAVAVVEQAEATV